MKQSSRKQPIISESPVEPVLLASPSLSPSREEQPEGEHAVENFSSNKIDSPREAQSHPRSTRGTPASILPILWNAYQPPPTHRRRIKQIEEKIKYVLAPPPVDLYVLIDSFPIPKGEKATLVEYLEGRIDPENHRAFWKLETQFQEVLKHLIEEMNEERPNVAIKQFLNLLAQRIYQGPGIGLTAFFVDMQMRALCKKWEEDHDIKALGEAISALEAGKGAPLEDPQEIAEEWIRRAILKVAKEHLPGTGSGRSKEMPPEKEKEIIADCKKWCPICEDLNERFKKLWKQSEYESSELHRKEARGLLAEKWGISVKEVKTIERVLKTPSRTSSKSTPFEAMLQMVALDHVDIGIKTIEGIWLAYLKDHPEESRKRRKRSTIRTAERTP